MNELNRPRDGRIFLKVKLKSLAAEARIIRQAERRTTGAHLVGEMTNEGIRVKMERHKGWHEDPERFLQYRQLHRHRTVNVRVEARNTLAAYAFLRGRPVARVFPRPPKGGRKTGKVYAWPDAEKVAVMVRGYGLKPSGENAETFKAAKAAEQDRLKAWLEGK